MQTEFSTYETDALVSQYCEFHYGDENFGVANFAKAYADLAIELAKTDTDLANRTSLSVLEVGCSVGRASFELAKHFDQVTGLDFSARFIQVANQLKQTGSVLYTLPIEGEIMDFKERSLTDLGLQTEAHKCQFLQQDASNMKPHFKGYDMIVAANLIDRLYEPTKFLEDVAARLNPGGILLITSPYSWSEQYTLKANWLGGYKDNQSGENVTTLEGLHGILDSDFKRLREPFDLAFVIRETARKFQHTLSEVTIWKKLVKG